MLSESQRQTIKTVLLNAGVTESVINLELDRLDMMTKKELDLYLNKGIKNESI